MSKLTFKRTAASQFSAQNASQGGLSCFPLRVVFYSFLDLFLKRTDLDSSDDFSVEFNRMFCFALQGSAQMPRPCVGPQEL